VFVCPHASIARILSSSVIEIRFCIVDALFGLDKKVEGLNVKEMNKSRI